MREQCEVKGADCEVFTRCVAIATPAATYLACPTCAEAMGAPSDIVQAMVQFDVEAGTNPAFDGIDILPMSPPLPAKHHLVVEYVDIVMGKAYGRGLALCQ